ncbi:hypothetical protein AAG570_004708 [Ranatra chinensis]|uniref:Uncharacterized protein n=1 Tax=Ranatra chinensis TaxID=642074 RepID=A0ABD0Y1M2_9HEMI
MCGVQIGLEVWARCSRNGRYYRGRVIDVANTELYILGFHDRSFIDDIQPKYITSHDCVRQGPPPEGTTVNCRIDGHEYNAFYIGRKFKVMYTVKYLNNLFQVCVPSDSIYSLEEKKDIDRKMMSKFSPHAYFLRVSGCAESSGGSDSNGTLTREQSRRIRNQKTEVFERKNKNVAFRNEDSSGAEDAGEVDKFVNGQKYYMSSVIRSVIYLPSGYFIMNIGLIYVLEEAAHWYVYLKDVVLWSLLPVFAIRECHQWKIVNWEETLKMNKMVKFLVRNSVKLTWSRGWRESYPVSIQEVEG